MQLKLYRPVSGRWLSQGRSQRLESQSQRKASPSKGVAPPGRRQIKQPRGSVAKARRRLGEGVAQPGGRQIKQC